MSLVERDSLAHAIHETFKFYGKQLNEVQTRIWLRSLKTMNHKSVIQALADYCSIGKYAPKPVDIIDLAKDIVEEQRRKDESALPSPVDTLRPAEPLIARAYAWLLMQRMGGATPKSWPTPRQEEIDQYLEIVNRYSFERSQLREGDSNYFPDYDPDAAIPPDCWLTHIWGRPHREAALL